MSRPATTKETSDKRPFSLQSVNLPPGGTSTRLSVCQSVIEFRHESAKPSRLAMVLGIRERQSPVRGPEAILVVAAAHFHCEIPRMAGIRSRGSGPVSRLCDREAASAMADGLDTGHVRAVRRDLIRGCGFSHAWNKLASPATFGIATGISFVPGWRWPRQRSKRFRKPQATKPSRCLPATATCRRHTGCRSWNGSPGPRI